MAKKINFWGHITLTSSNLKYLEHQVGLIMQVHSHFDLGTVPYKKKECQYQLFDWKKCQKHKDKRIHRAYSYVKLLDYGQYSISCSKFERFEKLIMQNMQKVACNIFSKASQIKTNKNCHFH